MICCLLIVFQAPRVWNRKSPCGEGPSPQGLAFGILEFIGCPKAVLGAPAMVITHQPQVVSAKGCGEGFVREVITLQNYGQAFQDSRLIFIAQLGVEYCFGQDVAEKRSSKTEGSNVPAKIGTIAATCSGLETTFFVVDGGIVDIFRQTWNRCDGSPKLGLNTTLGQRGI